MNILFITFGLPVPPSSGARIRDFNLICRVAREHDVSVLSLLEFPGEREHMQAMRAYCRHVDGVVADRSWLGTLGVGLQGLRRGRPLATAPFYYPDLARRIRQLTQEQRFDIVQIEHSFLAPYRADVAEDFGGAVVLSLHNIGAQQYRSMLDMSRGLKRIPAALKWLSLRRWEGRVAGQFDLSIVVSAQDRDRLEHLAEQGQPIGSGGSTRRISIVGNGVDTKLLLPLPEPRTRNAVTDGAQGGELIFVGTMGYLPNRDAMQSFCRDVLPIVRKQRPGCRLTIVGSGGRKFLSHLVQPGQVEITDRVEDVTPYYQRAHVAIAPLRSGGGSRLKILEAMALGRPVVSSHLGCEGLDLEGGRDLLIADEPEAFARQILHLLSDQESWRKLAHDARQTVVSRHDWDAIARGLLQVYARLKPAENSSATGDSGAPVAALFKPPRVSVIIPVYNAMGSLGKCLDALDRSRTRDFELIVVDDSSTDGSDKLAQQRCENFVRLQENRGAAAARNRGASLARSELLFFLDADVLIEPDTLDNIMQVFTQEPSAAATFCSYQNDTPEKNFASQYKNLLHHYTHQISGREAATFCGGYGAIRRDVFLQAGGFDEHYRAMEDVELGYRLHQAGHRIVLSSAIQLTHTKRYTLASLVRADVFQRAIPWTKIMLQRRIFHRDLNLRANNLASMVTVFLMFLAPLLPSRLLPGLALTETILLLLFILLNRRFLVFLVRMRGPWFALRAVPMVWLQYCYSGVGLALGVLSFMKDSLVRNNLPGPEKIK